jgi:hypothetical protein
MILSFHYARDLVQGFEDGRDELRDVDTSTDAPGQEARHASNRATRTREKRERDQRAASWAARKWGTEEVPTRSAPSGEGGDGTGGDSASPIFPSRGLSSALRRGFPAGKALDR